MSKIDSMLRELGSAHWAISERAFESLVATISNNELTEEIISEQKSINSNVNDIDGTWYAKKIGKVGILEITGVLIPYKTWYERWFGFVSAERLEEDLSVLQKDHQIENIIAMFDTPGGMVDGLSGFADVLANSAKPITAHILGDAASGGYWLASQAKEITAIDTSRSGSIGAVTTIVDFKEAYEKKGIKIFDVVSSQSPRKRTDLTTEEGRMELQAILDSIADTFIDTVARGRNIDREVVLNNFGQGGEFASFESLERGLIDRIINTNDLIESFNTNNFMVQTEREPLKIQSLIFSKENFTREQAVDWAKDHDFKYNKVDETNVSFRLRQKEPNEFKDFVTKELDTGVKAVMGHLRNRSNTTNNNEMSLSATSERKGKSMGKEKTDGNLVDDKDIDIDKIKNESAKAERDRIKSIESIKDDYNDLHPNVKEAVSKAIDGFKFDADSSLESIKFEISKIAIKESEKVINSMRDSKKELNSKIENIPDVTDQKGQQNNKETVDPESPKIKNMVKGFNSVSLK